MSKTWWGREPVNQESLASYIDSVIPDDRTFTTVDIMATVEALDNKRNWRKQSVNHHITQFRKRRIVRRIKKSQNTQRGVYVRMAVEYERNPLEDMTLADVVHHVLSERQPLRVVELVVAIIEAGYGTTLKPAALKSAACRVLREDERYREHGDQWQVSR